MITGLSRPSRNSRPFWFTAVLRLQAINILTWIPIVRSGPRSGAVTLVRGCTDVTSDWNWPDGPTGIGTTKAVPFGSNQFYEQGTSMSVVGQMARQNESQLVERNWMNVMISYWMISTPWWIESDVNTWCLLPKIRWLSKKNFQIMNSKAFKRHF